MWLFEGSQKGPGTAGPELVLEKCNELGHRREQTKRRASVPRVPYRRSSATSKAPSGDGDLGHLAGATSTGTFRAPPHRDRRRGYGALLRRVIEVLRRLVHGP